MDYKSTWKFSREGDYTLDDRAFAMPADCLYRDISVPVGEGYTLSTKKDLQFKRNIHRCD